MNELPFDSLHEECGVFGVFGVDDAPGIVYYGLHALQHRGQEACGIVSAEEGRLASVKGEGLVTEVFNGDNLSTLHGRMAIGHVRYSTAGASNRENAQPLIIHYIKGTLAVAHNGNLTNAVDLREKLKYSGAIFQTTIDSETIAYYIARERVQTKNVQEAVSRTMDKIEGAYALAVMSPRKLIGARDPYGFKPLCIGKRDNTYFLSSETCALDAVGAEFVRDVEPGEIVTITPNGILSDKSHCLPAEKQGRCIFEYIYFARPDSDIEGRNVHAFRKESGRLLFKEAPADADVVIGVPDSSLSAAIGYSEASGIPYEMGLVKNRYIGRTFIQPSQAMREKGVKMKLSAVRSLVAGKRVALIDDSIVRGTTSLRIVRLLKAAGAKEVHVRIASPKMTHPCFYGVDTSTCDQLIGHRCSVEEICRQIEADSLAFLSEGALLRAGNRKEMCMACFTGRYPTALYEHAAEIGRKEDKNR